MTINPDWLVARDAVADAERDKEAAVFAVRDAPIMGPKRDDALAQWTAANDALAAARDALRSTPPYA